MTDASGPKPPEWSREDRRTFRTSLYRIIKVHPHFLNRFYEVFLASSPEISEKFAHVDMEKQKTAVKESFFLIVSAATDRAPWALEQLNRLAHQHRKLNITSEQYALWRKSLLNVVRECDPQFDEDVERSWLGMTNFGIHYLQHRPLK